jgi:hypothetical protein
MATFKLVLGAKIDGLIAAEALAQGCTKADIMKRALALYVFVKPVERNGGRVLLDSRKEGEETQEVIVP